jgi:hypothetical protein
MGPRGARSGSEPWGLPPTPWPLALAPGPGPWPWPLAHRCAGRRAPGAWRLALALGGAGAGGREAGSGKPAGGGGGGAPSTELRDSEQLRAPSSAPAHRRHHRHRPPQPSGLRPQPQAQAQGSGLGLRGMGHDQLRDHTGQKARCWLVLKEIIRAAPCFFCVCWHGALVNNISARINSRREAGGPAQRLQAAVEQLTGEHSTPTLDFFRAISAGECLCILVSTVALCGAKLNSLAPLGSVGLPLLKITT